MFVGRILSPVHSLGPGERVCLWTQGCKRGCSGCIATELQDTTGNEVDEATLAIIVQKIAEKGKCTGLTISGGDPFEQPDSMLVFLKSVRRLFDDILVYTGFTMEEILCGRTGEGGKQCLNFIDVLIDGPYIKELNSSECILRGSTNQTIHFLNKKNKEKYIAYMKKGRIVENFIHDGKTIVTGILNEV